MVSVGIGAGNAAAGTGREKTKPMIAGAQVLDSVCLLPRGEVGVKRAGRLLDYPHQLLA